MGIEKTNTIDPTANPEAGEAAAVESGKATIVLVVDDEYAARTIAELVLKSEGYDVVLAKNGQEALECAKRLHPHLILLDYNMPGMDGLEVCRHLRQESCFDEIPIVFLTGMDSAADQAEGFATGYTDYIAKPIEPVEFLPRIRAHLQRVQDDSQQ